MSCSFEDYLRKKVNHRKVLESYIYYQEQFMKWLEGENLTVENCQYADLLSYVKLLKAKERSIYNLNNYIRGIKYYYEYLQSIEEVENNPARRLYIKGDVYQLPSDLLNKRELNTIYVDCPSETLAQKRNKVLLGLAIYQALRQDEIAALTPEDINLHQGTIYIRKTGRGVRRTLKLEAHQILPLQEYIKEVLPQIRTKVEKPTDKLIMSLGKNPDLKELVSSLMKVMRKQYPRFRNLLHVRSSVISLWIEERNIIEVQYMAGHNSITSTERYKRVSMQDLRKALDQFHPLN
jgi:site-specific recombinase XerD